MRTIHHIDHAEIWWFKRALGSKCTAQVWMFEQLDKCNQSVSLVVENVTRLSRLILFEAPVTSYLSWMLVSLSSLMCALLFSLKSRLLLCPRVHLFNLLQPLKMKREVAETGAKKKKYQWKQHTQDTRQIKDTSVGEKYWISKWHAERKRKKWRRRDEESWGTRKEQL